MYKIQTYNKISDKGLSLFDKAKYDINENHKDADGIILRSYNLLETEFPSTIKAIGRAGAGTNNVPSDRCTDQGIVVFNAPGANANAVKELVLAALFMSSRRVYESITWAQTLKDGETDVPAQVEKGKSNFEGPEIMEKTIGVIGLGAIGGLVANACDALGMKVLGYDPFISPEAKANLSSNVVIKETMEEIFAVADYLSLHLPVNSDTKGMFNAALFEKCKEGIRIVNFARGGLIKDADMVAAVKSGKVAKYITDFPTEALLNVDNIIPIPHLGASSPESEENCAKMVVNQVSIYLETGNVINSVNFPNVTLPVNGKRITACAKGNSELLTDVTAELKSAGISSTDMISKTRGDVTYVIVNTDKDAKSVEEKVKKLNGVVLARAI
ncbi:MAG: 3-phosphoglycerate dehydrogenase [Spirochaetales bacterium]|nr:3-phosphoglycerate dehydrogenase [Spirochaetales bacterium]